jgi:hypothetical protein
MGRVKRANKNRLIKHFDRGFYAYLAAFLVISICILTLFVKPVVGMADNGDYFRIISQNNLYHIAKEYDDIYLGYFNKNYGIFEFLNDNEKTIISTQSFLIRAAVFIDTFITKDNLFDIRFLAGIYTIIAALAAFFVVWSLTINLVNKVQKYIITVLFVIIFCDVGYLAYFNSFYGEAMNITFFLLSVGVLMFSYSIKKVNTFYLGLFVVTSYVFIGSKQQLAPVGILVFLILVRYFFILKGTFNKILCLVFSVFIITSSAYFYLAISGDFDYINRYHAMTRGILLNEEEPEKILKEFNINPQYSLLQENIFYNNIPIIHPKDDKLIKEFYSNYSFGGIIKFYIKNPKTFMKMLELGVEHSYSIRPDVIGNYEKSEGKQYGAKSYFFSLWSTAKANYFLHGLGVTVFAAIIYFVAAILRYLQYRKNKNISFQLMEELFLYIFLVGLSQIFVSIIGAGDADLAKHVFMFNISFDLMVLFSLSKFFEKKI